MAKSQRGDSEARSEQQLNERMSDLSDDDGPEEVTFDDSKAVALKSVKDAQDSVKRYSGLRLLALLLTGSSGLNLKPVLKANLVHYSVL